MRWNVTKTPDALEAEIVRLRQALSPDGSGPVSADVMRDHLRQHGGDVLPSRRTIYRILNRQAKEVNSHRKTEKKRHRHRRKFKRPFPPPAAPLPPDRR